MFCSLRRKYQTKEIQYHRNEIQLKEIASSLRFHFSFESNFCCSLCVFSFCFSLLQRKKERVIHFLLPSSYFASYFFKKKKKGFHLTSFAICHFLNLLFSKIFFVVAFVLSSSQLLLLHFSNQKKKTLPTFPFEGLFTLVSQGFRKSENQLTNLWREGERYFV